MRLDNKTAVITGGTSGIGYGIVKKFIQEGAMVFVLGIDEKAIKFVSAELSRTSYESAAFLCDVGNSRTVRSIVTKIAEQNKIDILVNNAGINPSPKMLTATTSEEWDIIINTNLKSIFNVSNAVIPRMSTGSSIINISSILAYSGVPECSAYTASKGGILALTKSMAIDYAPTIRVNCICPGAIDTSMFEEFLTRSPDPQQERNRIKDTIPLKRIGTPEDIANAVLFLASDESRWITGINLIVDGGDSI